MKPGGGGWRDSQPELVERIRGEIAAAPDGRITFARFMQRALTEPGLGYYVTNKERPTRSGDFLTAAELHPLFGRCIGRLLVGAATRLGTHERLAVREYGAGGGTLERETRAGLAAEAAALKDSLEWHGIDVPGRGTGAPSEPFTGLVLASEYLDALPVHRLVHTDGKLMEAWVGWHNDWFAEVVAPLSDSILAEPVAAAGVTLAENQRVEVCPAADAWLARVAAELTAGVILVIDYGHPATELYGPRRPAGSLITYRDHVAGDDPFDAVGRQDITAHVNFTALAGAAAEAGLATVGSTTQAEFLTRLGLGELLSELGRQPDTEMHEYAEARAAVARFIDPRHLGGFRVVAWERAPGGTASGQPPLPGFATA